MSSIASATAADLSPVLEAFRAVEWPLSREGMAALADGLAWQPRSLRAKGMTYLTGLPYPKARADVLLRGDQVLDVTIGLSEPVDDDADSRAQLRAIAADLARTTTAVLGTSARTGGGRRVWDLPTGGRIALAGTDYRVRLEVLSRYVADVERAEERYGVDPNRIVGVDPEPI